MELLLISQLDRQCWHVSQLFWWYQLADLFDFVYRDHQAFLDLKETLETRERK